MDLCYLLLMLLGLVFSLVAATAVVAGLISLRTNSLLEFASATLSGSVGIFLIAIPLLIAPLV